MSCKWYKCTRPTPDKVDFCIQHSKMMGIEKPKKEPKPIAKKSDNQKSIDKELKKLYPIFLAEPENERCAVKQKGCLGKATVVHHVRGRIGEQVFETKDWMPSCIWCNMSLENDPKAKEKGLKKSKFYE